MVQTKLVSDLYLAKFLDTLIQQKTVLSILIK